MNGWIGGVFGSIALAAGITSPAAGQRGDTLAVKPAYEAAVALRAQYERDHGHFVTANGIRIHYLEWGPRTATSLIWLHGSASTGYEIRRVAPALVAAGYRVIAPDYRGHGQTPVTDYEFTIWDIADDVVGLMDSLHIARAVIGGASKGGFIAAAVYDQYKPRVLGLLLADGGSWSNQWIFDHHGLDGARREVADAPPVIVASSELGVFAQLVGGPPPAGTDPDKLLDPLLLITPRPDGQWALLDGFDKLMGSAASYLAGATAPSTMPLLQWSQHAMLPLAVFRRVAIPVMVLDPEEPNDNLPVTDQNDRLAALHPRYVIHQRYPETGHAVLRLRPEWFVRDATTLLRLVREHR
jgi:pimeloyl-ACP methyl ester carboxylesterase